MRYVYAIIQLYWLIYTMMQCTNCCWDIGELFSKSQFFFSRAGWMSWMLMSREMKSHHKTFTSFYWSHFWSVVYNLQLKFNFNFNLLHMGEVSSRKRSRQMWFIGLKMDFFCCNFSTMNRIKSFGWFWMFANKSERLFPQHHQMKYVLQIEAN